ncbi:superoxide dismutase [Pseudonocardia sp.]|uniref:superoxide dismutase n=1 Tax=Pseudonocardia sp. TaxID=60912 RepID=UPI00260759BC|nr:superoxide dismutase [Pseudonocardia sp.]
MRSSPIIGLCVIGAFALTACGGAAASSPAATPSSTPDRSVQVGATFGTDPGDVAITYDPALVPVGARAAVSSETGDDGTVVMLAVRGLQPDRRYGAHAHVEACGDTGDAAGPHFQNEVDPVQPSVDPAYANPQNEIWLDLTTDSAGAGNATADVEWGFDRDRRAKSVIIHEMGTATAPGEAGKAGARPACINVEF